MIPLMYSWLIVFFVCFFFLQKKKSVFSQSLMATPSTQPTAVNIEPQINHEIVGIGSLLFVTIILITLFSSKLITIFKFHHLNESIISF